MLRYIEKGDRRIFLYREDGLLRIIGRHRIADERRLGYWLGSVRAAFEEGRVWSPAYVVAWALIDAYHSDTEQSRIPMGLLTKVAEVHRLDALERLTGRRLDAAPPFTSTDYHAALRNLADEGFLAIIPGSGRIMNSYHPHLPTAEACARADAQTTS